MISYTTNQIDLELAKPRIFELCESHLEQEYTQQYLQSDVSTANLKKRARAYSQSVLTPMVERERCQILATLSSENRTIALLRAQPRDDAALKRAFQYALTITNQKT
ncbi:hypothetical protein [Vibrio harveyi]|uniref:hypothetical protein n=1 Tax=Vibrio harveyi TaxID=669 RepID=UPI003BB6BC80